MCSEALAFVTTPRVNLRDDTASIYQLDGDQDGVIGENEVAGIVPRPRLGGLRVAELFLFG